MPTDALTRIDRSIKFPRIVLAQPGVKSQSFQSQTRIPSHEIEEKWSVHYYPERGEIFPGREVEFGIKFCHQEQLIGESHLKLNPNVASVMTCWFQSHVIGQGLGTEFAARIFTRASEISKIIGWNPPFAYAYYFLTENEHHGFDYSNQDRPVYACFRRIGLSRDFSLWRHFSRTPFDTSTPTLSQLANTGLGNLNGHGAYLEDVYNNCLRSWKAWFYAPPYLDEARQEIDLAEAERALNANFDATREALINQLEKALAAARKG